MSSSKTLFSRVFGRKNLVIELVMSGRKKNKKKPFGRFDFLAKYSTCVLQISHMVSSGSLHSCDAMFFSACSQFFGEKCNFWR